MMERNRQWKRRLAALGICAFVGLSALIGKQSDQNTAAAVDTTPVATLATSAQAISAQSSPAATVAASTTAPAVSSASTTSSSITSSSSAAKVNTRTSSSK